ncbi:MAG: right-handed parallel beta-helix repeat-containing protein, partial [Bacteroidota bacterium]
MRQLVFKICIAFLLIGGLFMITHQGSASDPQKTIYINPLSLQEGVRDGTIKKPYNSLGDLTLKNNVKYLIKCGSSDTLTTAIILNRKRNITISSYGEGSKPVLSSNQNRHLLDIAGCENIKIDNLAFDGTDQKISCIRIRKNSSLITISECSIKNSIWGVRLLGNASQPLTQKIRISRCTIRNIADDGIFAQNIHELSIDSCHIEKVNQKYLTIG